MVIISAGNILHFYFIHCFPNQECPTVLHIDKRYMLADIQVMLTECYTQFTNNLGSLLLFALEEISLGICHSDQIRKQFSRAKLKLDSLGLKTLHYCSLCSLSHQRRAMEVPVSNQVTSRSKYIHFVCFSSLIYIPLPTASEIIHSMLYNQLSHTFYILRLLFISKFYSNIFASSMLT